MEQILVKKILVHNVLIKKIGNRNRKNVEEQNIVHNLEKNCLANLEKLKE